jgi:transposase-like protein
MQRMSESKRRGPVGSRTGEEQSTTLTTLTELGRRFALFRAERGAGARVPKELRGAVFEALRDGVTVRELRRECGVTGSQISRWEASREGIAKGVRRQTSKVRAFSVVEDVTPKAVPEQALELRVGPWAVSVRLAGQPPVGGG